MPEATSDTDLIRFFQRYARTSMAHESDALAAMYGPNFLVGGPRGSKVFANDARFVAWFSELRARFAGRTPLLSRAALAMGSLDIVVDASKARTALGWSPRPLEDRLRETMAWYVEIYRVRGAPLPVKDLQRR